ncbi:acyl-CoA dehydrogenase family protein [Nocardioides ochotonae]|uniref:acyl-CoA dehydrogenase family protein n=1 Tax=Nocardioides ochotonae TaxID=2685869 RepID=UPI00140CDF69|nr:acyl-CoA dehydrogenase family protein [Nocardioides ochotonae]
MDFQLDDDLREVADLAAKIFADRCDSAHLRTVEQTQGGFDRDLWRLLADSGLLGLTLSEEHGGAGLGAGALLALLEQQGRRTAPVPLWAVITCGAEPLAGHGTPEQQARWLPGLLDGTTPVTGHFEVAADGTLPLHGRPDGDGWVLSGVLDLVVAAPVAAAVVLPFATPDGPRVAVLATDRLRVEAVRATDNCSAGSLDAGGVRVGAEDLLAVDGATIIDRTRTRARVALAALATGVGAEAVAMTAAYTSRRIQFDRPLSTNQAVALRAADAHLDAERVRLTALKAAWHLDRGEHAEARAASLVAKWWTATGGLRAVHATQHLHGGIGADLDYPIHRYFLWGRQLAFTLGSAGAVETELGDLLADLTPIGAPA